ncbi:uroporphyrinogen-III synthase [Staphylococcus caeli]|uniref:uroporphyrinogen-III synthase n=1 Tax=Staphylococcus caeli TaxID=2201815 RepID=UPI003F57DD7F
MRPVIVMTQTSEFERNDVCIIHKPFISIMPLSFDLNLLNVNYDWLIFSSKNAVKVFRPFLKKVRYRQLAVIGKKTADYCASIGLEVDFYPDDFSQEGFLEAFSKCNQGRILLPSSAEARPLLEQSLRNYNDYVEKIDLYKPVPHKRNIEDVKTLIKQGQLDALTFASSSAVRYFFENNEDITLEHYFVIGEQTLNTLNQYHAQGKIADVQTLEALVNKILESWNEDAI